MRTDPLRLPAPGATSLLAPGYGALAAIIAIVAFLQPLVAAGLIFAVLGLALTKKRPEIALMLILAATPFQKDISGGGRDNYAGGMMAFSIAELLLAALLPCFLINGLVQRRRLFIGPIMVPVFLYLAICLGASVLNWRGTWTVLSLGQMLLYLILAVTAFASFVRKPEDLLLALNSLIGIGTFLAVLSLTGAIGLLGLNKNGAGASLAIALLICTELWFAADRPKRKAQLACAMTVLAAGLIFSLSRGAWLGTLAGLVFIFGCRREFRLLVRTGVLLALVVVMAWRFVPEDKQSYALDFRPTAYNINARFKSIDIARSYFEQSPVYGVGVGLRKQVDATNIFWFTLAETGILGLATFLLIHVVFFRMIWTTQKRVPRTDKTYSLVVLGGALVLYKLTHGMVDHYWSRGPLLIAWSTAGMATRVYYSARHLPTVQEAL